MEDLSLGEAAPTIRAMKIYDTAPDKIILDSELIWETFRARLRLRVRLKGAAGRVMVPVEVRPPLKSAQTRPDTHRYAQIQRDLHECA